MGSQANEKRGTVVPAHDSPPPDELSESDLVIATACQSASNASDVLIGFPPGPFLSSVVGDHCLTWCPDGLPDGDSQLIASSRLNQQLERQSDWFDALRTLAVQLFGNQVFLLTAKGTTTDPFVRRIGVLFEIPVVTLVPFPVAPTRRWFAEATATTLSSKDPLDRTLYFKPLESTTDLGTRVAIDDVLVSIAKSVVLLSVRPNGNICDAAQNRLDAHKPCVTRLLVNRSLTPKRVESTLLKNGATGWWLYGDCHLPSTESATPSPMMLANPLDQVILNFDDIKTDNYLIHWTRRRVGPWPDQTNDEFLDDLIFHSTRSQHGELSTLCRILASRRILASNDLTRDRRPVVCFSEITIDELPQRRVFRPHLSRWDFEPYGLAIDRDLLEHLSAQPVVYGSDERWKSLTDLQRPFFQLNRSASKKIEWEQEKEWRILGDVRLGTIARDQAFVFVRTAAEAETISELSPWPIVVLFPEK